MISIITPSFNRSYIIDETAQSVFAQTDSRWQWIIVDDGSTDDSWEKLKTYATKDSRVRIFRRGRQPKGACTCRNIGAEQAEGDHLIFLDTDDLLGPDAIKKRMAYLDSAPNSEIPYFPIVTFQDSPTKGFYWDDLDHPVSWLTGLFMTTPPCQGTSPFWRKSDFFAIGGWTEDLKVWQDIELHLRAYANGLRFEPVNRNGKPDIFLRISPDSISRVNFNSAEKCESRWSVVEYVMSTFNADNLSADELGALQNMTLGVLHNALSLRAHNLIDRIIKRANQGSFLTDSQVKWMKKAKRDTWLRLYKIPLLAKRLRKQQQELFPFRQNRKLGVRKWEQ